MTDARSEPRSSGNRVTIKDVASAVGVSKSAVSLALRGDTGVSDDTRKRVQEAAEQLGYRSNVWARSLVEGSIGLIGILLTDLNNDYHTAVVQGIEDRAATEGQGVIIANGRRSPERLAAHLRKLVELQCDGIVIVSAHTPSDALQQAATTTPVVVVGRPDSVPATVSNIRNDDETGARLAVNHLVAQGRTRIAFIQKSESASILARRDSYLSALHDHGLTPRVLTRDELDQLSDCDGVFASNDVTASQVLGWAADHSVSVPEDLAVVGYDDTQLGRIVRPQLSSIAQPRLAMGERAVEILRSGETVHDVFDPWLVVRASSGAERLPSRI